MVGSSRRVIVAGSRRWEIAVTAIDVVGRLAKKHGAGLVVVHGDCPTGVDRSFAQACRILGVAQEPHPARWDDLGHPRARVRRRADGAAYNANAGPLRNQEMADAGAVACLVFHPELGERSGTADMARRALRAGIATWWVDHEDHPPRRIALPGPWTRPGGDGAAGRPTP